MQHIVHPAAAAPRLVLRLHAGMAARHADPPGGLLASRTPGFAATDSTPRASATSSSAIAIRRWMEISDDTGVCAARESDRADRQPQQGTRRRFVGRRGQAPVQQDRQRPRHAARQCRSDASVRRPRTQPHELPASAAARIYAVTRDFNLMLEGLVEWNELVNDARALERETTFTLNPGFRKAFNFPGRQAARGRIRDPDHVLAGSATDFRPVLLSVVRAPVPAEASVERSRTALPGEVTRVISPRCRASLDRTKTTGAALRRILRLLSIPDSWPSPSRSWSPS